MRHLTLLALTICGCGAPAHPESPAAAEPADVHAELSDASPPAQGETAPDKTTQTAEKPVAPERPARTSPPPGVSPLSKEEQEYAKTQCGPLLKAVEREAKKQKGKDAVSTALGVLKKPPAAKNVDVPKCAALLIRDLETYRAKTIEIEALQTMKRIGVGLASVLTRQPPGMCPSAPPTPKALEDFSEGPVNTKAADWSAEGWRCAGFAADGPIRFQYELRTDLKAKKYEIIARGYPGSSTTPTELIFRVPARTGEADLTQPIFRR